MASLMESIMGQLASGGNLKNLSRGLNSDEAKTGPAAGAAISALLGALAKNSSSDDGAQALNRALEKKHDGSVMDQLGSALGGAGRGDGEKILGHIFGGKRDSVQNGLSQATGIDKGAAGGLLATLAPIVMGALGKQKRERGMDSSGLAALLGDERRSLEKKQPAAMGALSGLLDSDGDGDVDLKDLAKHGAGLLGKFLKR
ncbi:MAG: DUF937 domain-containing protein [Acidobacteriota bacterium]|nr:DUF937 domain-containing protein [Acidobacteriota bacterium]MDH3786406.1 DUF937 domain-containing protein [Acidobacteriota bacterium]